MRVLAISNTEEGVAAICYRAVQKLRKERRGDNRWTLKISLLVEMYSRFFWEVRFSTAFLMRICIRTFARLSWSVSEIFQYEARTGESYPGPRWFIIRHLLVGAKTPCLQPWWQRRIPWNRLLDCSYPLYTSFFAGRRFRALRGSEPSLFFGKFWLWKGTI